MVAGSKVPVMRQCLDWAEQPLVLARELEDAFRRFDYDASGALDRKESLCWIGTLSAVLFLMSHHAKSFSHSVICVFGMLIRFTFCE